MPIDSLPSSNACFKRSIRPWNVSAFRAAAPPYKSDNASVVPLKSIVFKSAAVKPIPNLANLASLPS